MSCRRSERDGKIIARRLGCNKEGYRVNKRDKAGAIRKPKPITREGCKAMIYLKFNKSGKWVVAKFEREHNHPLVVSPREARHTTVSAFIKFSNGHFCIFFFLLKKMHHLVGFKISCHVVHLACFFFMVFKVSHLSVKDIMLKLRSSTRIIWILGKLLVMHFASSQNSLAKLRMCSCNCDIPPNWFELVPFGIVLQKLHPSLSSYIHVLHDLHIAEEMVHVYLW